MTKDTLYYDQQKDSIQFKESGHHVAQRVNNRWVSQPSKALGPELSSRLFMALSFIHELAWGNPEAVTNSLQMLVDVGDLALTDQRQDAEGMSVKYNEYSDTVRLMPANYMLAIKDPRPDGDGWICHPDMSVPHDIARKTFLLLNMKDDLKTASGETLAGKIQQHALSGKKSLESEEALGR